MSVGAADAFHPIEECKKRGVKIGYSLTRHIETLEDVYI
jgi:hypothetical protein